MSLHAFPTLFIRYKLVFHAIWQGQLLLATIHTVAPTTNSINYEARELSS